MYRERPNRKAPAIDILARHLLAARTQRHAEIAKHVENIEELEKMEVWVLLTLA
jgi:hypothetical protein